ncbi:hypothetical protein OG909_10210 [Streptomyces sp. NBC_01754]|uniref:hypothetical protein n=1 Tax=Streptomyces sp. NBC_01754 TaxID=2975930 RepID=UPI002DDA6FFB|nr:hypothetical protein [Streptomyces sp. NBC_01754]WSC92636.1 hypothetical protein OG909_10210 [Streptomyces sp. NBC_01754]
MRSLSLTFCATVAAAAIALPASAAAVDPAPKDPKEHQGSGSVTVTPSTAVPGGEVELWTDVCGKGTSARGNSEAFTSEARFAPAGGKGLRAKARIRTDAVPDAYEIRVTCKDGHGRATGTVTVVHRRASPAAPVRAGGGGTATLATGRQAGPGLPHAVTGLALGTVAVAAVAFLGARRRRSEHG